MSLRDERPLVSVIYTVGAALAGRPPVYVPLLLFLSAHFGSFRSLLRIFLIENMAGKKKKRVS